MIGSSLLAVVLVAGTVRGADVEAGRRKSQTCAACHGAAGEGTKEYYPKPLAGERSVPQLARLIAKTMPKDDDGACVGAGNVSTTRTLLSASASVL